MAVKINNKTDKDYWQKYIAGSNEALSQLVDKYNSRLMAFLTARKCKDPESSCQEVWRKVIVKRDSFDGKSFSGWVFTIARNQFTEQIRKAARRGAIHQEWLGVK
jgi:DNA-directed RNA polymerase specialized sigma24 family protein